MAHFAKIENGTVTQVIVVANNDCGGGDFPQSEPIGQEFIRSIGLDGEWLQTSYNNNFRGSFAAIGYIYDSANDIFDQSDEAKAQHKAYLDELAAAKAKRENVLVALAAAAGLEPDEVRAALGA